MTKAIFSWSGGKDSAYCLQKVLSENMFEVKYLLTTINKPLRRISMHGVREELLERQSASIGIPLLKVYVKEACNEEYEANLERVLGKAKEEEIDTVIFGDIFLEDLRIYRENQLSKIGMNAVFPIWKMDTREMLRDFIEMKFQSILCCTSDLYLDKDWVGREIDDYFLSDIPSNVDPCGENGEYHSFCYQGPLFKKEIEFTKGEKVHQLLELKTTASVSPETIGFWYCDLIP